MNYPMTLEQYISQAALRETDLVRMGAQIAGALAVIHQQKKVHGDVRPANVLVMGDGNYQLIGMEPVRQFPQGNIPAFVAPELEQGAAYAPGIDIYALGMMMKSLEPRKEGVSTVLQEVIQKACEPDASKRFETALAFSNELEMICEAMMQSYGQTQPAPSMAQSYGQTQPAPNMAQPMQPIGQTQPAPSMAQSYGQTQPAPNMAQPMQPNRQTQSAPSMTQLEQSYRQTQPAPSMAQSYGQTQPAPNMTRPEQSYRQAQPERRPPVTQTQEKNTKTEGASLILRFVLPILIVLVVAAAVIAYVVLIRPSSAEKSGTTQEALHTVDSTEDATEEATTEETAERERTCVVPDVQGLEEASAKSKLEALKLTVAVRYDTSDTVAEGLVITQSIAENTTVSEQTEIVLTVSEGNGCPYEYSQKVSVTAAPGSTSGTLTLYNWENGDWVSKFSCACVVGKNGIGSDYGEGKGVTPLGTFKLGFVLGTSDPNNGMTYKQAGSTTAIVDDTASPLYNTLVDTSQAEGISVDPVGENIVSGKLSCVIFIEHNGNGITTENVVPGKGSVITICGNNHDISATAGCIDIKASDMSVLLTYLDGTKNPYIETGVN